MPALLTHYLCGNAMLKLIDDGQAKDIILKHRNVFNLGTQGPDIFFYYGAWPWTKSNGIPKLGSRMHEEKTGEFILEALGYAAHSDEMTKSILTAYMCGYICHYVLDCHTHPYIFYKTGFVRKGEAYTSKYTCYHRMFETALDVLMLKHELMYPTSLRKNLIPRLRHRRSPDMNTFSLLFASLIWLPHLHSVLLSGY